MKKTLERQVEEHQWSALGNENSLQCHGSREIDQHDEQSQGQRSNHGCSAGGKREFGAVQMLRNTRREKSRNGNKIAISIAFYSLGSAILQNTFFYLTFSVFNLLLLEC